MFRCSCLACAADHFLVGISTQGEPILLSTSHGRPTRRSWIALGTASILAAATTLVGCGGGEDAADGAQAQAASTPASTPLTGSGQDEIGLHVRSTKAYATPSSKTSPPLPSLPYGRPREGTHSCGTDARYYKDNTSNTNDYEERALINRHVSCESHQFNIEVVEEDKLVLGTRKTLGRMTGTIYLSVYGESNVLQKKVDVRWELSGWTPDPSNTTKPNPTVRFGMLVTCNPDFSAPGVCSPTYTQATQATLTLSSPPKPRPPGYSLPSATLTMPVGFSITAEPGKLPIAQFDPSVQFIYAASGGDVYDSRRYSQSLNVEARLPTLRCDQGVAHTGSSGCVFKKAAPVYVLRADDAAVSEAAIHIREAQAHGSPGKFVLKPNTWAIPDGSVLGDQALQRLKNKSVQDRTNRYVSCSAPRALIRVRQPVQYSGTCSATNLSQCQCDEYPFASTWSGGYFDPDRTSVRWINRDQNQASGTANLTNFYRDEHIIDPNNYPNDMLPENRYENGPGDDFWVHIPTQ